MWFIIKITLLCNDLSANIIIFIVTGVKGSLKCLPNLLPSRGSCSCKSASELKKGITLAELCWSTSVKTWQCFTKVLAKGESVAVLVLSSLATAAGSPITTTSFISIRCRNERPKAKFWTISQLSNTEGSTCRPYKHQL